MKLLKIALLTAIPVEAINSWLALHFPIDVGLPDGTGFWKTLLFVQAVWLHLPAYALVDRYHLPLAISHIVFVLIGYLITAILIFVILIAVRAVRSALFSAVRRPRTSC